MSLAAHLPALQVALPLIAAPLCSLLRGRALPWGFAVAVSWTTLVIAGLLLAHTLDDGVWSYALGSWAPPWGIEYRVDVLNAFMLVLVAGIAAVVTPFARLSVEAEIPADRHNLFYTAWLLCLTGLLGIAITGDAFNLFVFLEISSLASYILVGSARDRRCLTAAYQYLVMGTIGATFYLIGIGLIYMMTGTLNIADMAARLPAVADSTPIRAAAGFLTVGLALKFALFPLHLWLPNAYTYAPSAVSALLAATATKISIYVLLRFEFVIFGPNLGVDSIHFSELLVPLCVVGFLTGSTVAIFQSNLKRMLAYSSVAQVGYMVLGISFLSVAGLTGGIVHMFNHGMIKGALFMVMGCLVYRLGSVEIEDLRGAGRRMPWTMFAFVLGGLSLIGVPPTVGFISKWYLISAALAQGGVGVLIAGLILIGSLLAVIYVWRVVEVAYFQPAPEGAPAVAEAPLAMLVPLWLLIGANIYFGLHTDLTVGVAERAARFLLGLGA